MEGSTRPLDKPHWPAVVRWAARALEPSRRRWPLARRRRPIIQSAQREGDAGVGPQPLVAATARAASPDTDDQGEQRRDAIRLGGGGGSVDFLERHGVQTFCSLASRFCRGHTPSSSCTRKILPTEHGSDSLVHDLTPLARTPSRPPARARSPRHPLVQHPRAFTPLYAPRPTSRLPARPLLSRPPPPTLTPPRMRRAP
jgi:hypothetical protein